MKDTIYISTRAFKEKSIKDILELCFSKGLINLELGSNIEYSTDTIGLLKEFKGASMRFLLHNYFPRPQEDFVLNLASDDNEIIRRSIQHCKQAIELSAMLESPFYSVHAGFAFHASPADLGSSLIGLPRIPYERSYDIFLESIRFLAEYAQHAGVKLAVENNVVADFNLIGGENRLILLADALEAVNVYRQVSSHNLFYLIDLGHLKVSSTVLRFDRNEYLKEIMPYTIAFHLNDNDSHSDQHLLFDENSWFMDIISMNQDKFFIIETSSLNEAEIFNAIKILEKLPARRAGTPGGYCA